MAKTKQRKGNGRSRRNKNQNKSKHNNHNNKPDSEDHPRQAPPVADDIEAQLERQRRKRALSLEQSKTQDEDRRIPPETLGNFRYDSEKKAYFPKHYHNVIQDSQKIQLTNQRAGRDTAFAMLQAVELLNPSYPVFARQHSIRLRSVPLSNQLCLSSHQSKRLRYLWLGRLVSTRMQVLPSMKRQFDPISNKPKGWGCLLPQLMRSSNTEDRPAAPLELPWDLGCKTQLHASSRTFDILPATDSSRLPDIATIVDGGMFVRLATTDPRVWSARQYLGPDWERGTYTYLGRGFYSVRFASRNPAGFPSLTYMNARSRDRVRSSHFRPGEVTDDLTEGGVALNDAALRYGRIVMAPQISRPTQHISLAADEYTGQAFQVRASQFSKSDALCVEPSGRNIALYGHRNGDVSMVDFRQRKIEKAGNVGQQNGSVTGMTIINAGLDDNPKIFLAKGSFGACSLFDLRLRGQTKAKALLFDLEVDRELINPTLSSCCSGVAVDPTMTIAISPFVDNNRKTHFALWSLRNGRMIGSKPVVNEMQQQAALRGVQDRSGLPHCELRSIITPSWALVPSQDGKLTVKEQRRAWSLWFKCGTIETSSPNCMGSIHQLSLPGDLASNPDSSGVNWE